MATRKDPVSEEDRKKPLTLERIKGTLSIFQFVWPYRYRLLLGLVLLFVSSLVFMAFPWLSGLMIDIAQGKTKDGMQWTLKDVGLILLGVLIFQGVVGYLRVQLFAYASEHGIADLRQEVFKKMVSLPISFFEKSQTGELVSRVTSDAERLYNAFSITLAEFIRQIIILVTGVVFLAVSTPRLALVMLSTFPVIVIGAMFFGRSIRKLSKERQDKLADSNAVLGESVSSMPVVKAFTNEWFEWDRFNKSQHDVVKIAMRYASARGLFFVFISVVLFGAVFFIIWQAAQMVQAGSLTAGELVSFVSYTAILGGAIAGLGSFYTDILGAVGASERLKEILDLEPEVAMVPPSAVKEPSVKGHVTFNDVHFRYPSRSDVEVLRGIDLEILPGQSVALVGPSGAGKSTVVQLLQRFYDWERGDITIDGKSIRDLPMTEWRQHLAVVPQEVLLFAGSIRDNIRYGKPGASEAEILQAAKEANAMEFIQQFPEGLDTIVGERGVKLSGGQRQRIAIARAILRNPTILILDEATSSLDAESEKIVQDALNRLMVGRSSIVIAHRLATIKACDTIYVLEKGNIAEAGTHETLMQKSDGIYASLAKLQFDWAEA